MQGLVRKFKNFVRSNIFSINIVGTFLLYEIILFLLNITFWLLFFWICLSLKISCSIQAEIASQQLLTNNLGWYAECLTSDIWVYYSGLGLWFIFELEVLIFFSWAIFLFWKHRGLLSFELETFFALLKVIAFKLEEVPLKKLFLLVGFSTLLLCIVISCISVYSSAFLSTVSFLATTRSLI